MIMVFWAAITNWGETLEENGGARMIELGHEYMTRMGKAAWPALVAEVVAKEAWDASDQRPTDWPIKVAIMTSEEERLGECSVQLDFEPSFYVTIPDEKHGCDGCTRDTRNQPTYTIVGHLGRYCETCHRRITGKDID